MPLILPFVPSVPFYDLDTVIEGVSYTFATRWNTRADAWYFDLYADDGTPIVHNVKIVLGAYLGRTVHHPLFREGVIVAVDTERSRTPREATLHDLGTRVQVRRYTIPEIVGGDRSAIR